MTRSPAHPIAELYARLARALAGKRWYLFGARAAIHYGSVRGTVDIDIALALDGESPEHLLGRVNGEGFDARIPDWRELFEEARVLLLVDQSSGIEVDVVMTGPGLEEEFHTRARTARFGTTDVPVISAEDLLVGKMLAGRPQDLQDVEAVLAAQDSLDLGRVRNLLRAIERTLARADLVTAFDRLADSARKD